MQKKKLKDLIKNQLKNKVYVEYSDIDQWKEKSSITMSTEMKKENKNSLNLF